MPADCIRPILKKGFDPGFFDLGLDSLSALELRNALQADFGTTLPTTIAFQHPTVEALGAWLVDRIAPIAVSPPSPPTSQGQDVILDEAAVAAVAELSEADLAELVEAELQALLR